MYLPGVGTEHFTVIFRLVACKKTQKSQKYANIGLSRSCESRGTNFSDITIGLLGTIAVPIDTARNNVVQLR